MARFCWTMWAVLNGDNGNTGAMGSQTLVCYGEERKWGYHSLVILPVSPTSVQKCPAEKPVVTSGHPLKCNDWTDTDSHTHIPQALGRAEMSLGLLI